MAIDGEILFEHRGPLGLITLNRPKALNALTMRMIRKMSARLTNWAQDASVKAVVVQGEGDRAYCAGGDIMHIYEERSLDPDAPHQFGHSFFEAEYRLNRQVKVFPKPYIALIDGITMGGGVGISVHGSHRVASERTLFAMPETGIGFFPDVGGSYFLPRLPGKLGLFLGLTGWRLGPADCLFAEIATHYAPSFLNEGLIEALRGADWFSDPAPQVVDGVLQSFNQNPPPGDEGTGLAEIYPKLERCFAVADLDATMACLAAVGTPWAEKALGVLGKASPTSLKVTWEQLKRGADLSFDDCMTMEYTLSHAMLMRPDIYEGIRAALVDKDRQPTWRPASLDQVADDEVAAFFVEKPGYKLSFANGAS